MKNRGGPFVVLLVIGIIALLLVLIVSVQLRLNEIRKEKEDLEKRVEEYEDKVDELKYQLEREIDDEYIEDYARKKFGYYIIGDTIYYNDVRK